MEEHKHQGRAITGESSKHKKTALFKLGWEWVQIPQV